MSQRLSILWIGSALAIALACVASSEAQDGPGRGGRGGRGGFGGGGFGAEPLRLLSNEKVQKELDLTADQKDSLKKLGDEARAQRPDFASFRDLSEDDRRAKMEEMRTKMEEQGKAMKAKVDAVLLPNQLERLKQLTLQLRGANALPDPEVAKALSLSEDQQKQLTELRAAGDAQRRELFQGAGAGGGGDREALREKMTAIQKEQTDKTLAVLNADQKAQFEKMQGEKFEFPANLRRGGFGGPGGAAGGPGGGRPRRGGDNNQ